MKKTITIEVDDESLSVSAPDCTPEQIANILFAVVVRACMPDHSGDYLQWLLDVFISQFEKIQREGEEDD